MNTRDRDTELKETLKEKLGGRYPDHVIDVVTRHVTDSTGDPAVWVWVVLKDESLLDDSHRDRLEEIRAAAKDAVRSTGAGEWPYVTFRTRAEQEQIEAEAKRQ